MRFTDIFIKRPVLAISLSFLIALLGFQAIFKMQVREYPEVTNTVITVSTGYYGASSDLIQGFITQPLEQAVAQADNIDFMTSSSQLGSSTITAYMKLNTDPNAALSDILAKVNSVRSQLPKEAEDPSVTSSTGSTTAVLYLGFTSPELNSSQITDYLERVIKPQLFTVGGVSKVDLYGGVEFALRVWLDPAKMAAFNLTASDVMTVLNSNNYQSATGQATGYFTLFNGNAETQVKDVDELKRLVVATRDGKVIRLSDIAKVTLEKSHDIYRASANGREAVVMAVNAAPTANPINIAHDVLALLPSLERNMPSTMRLNVMYDSTVAINESIHEVIKTILEAAAIVLVVITLFLGSFRAVIIPIITIPLSLIGVVMMMDMFGFSINLMTLLAMVLAIGLVVDDAIVVLENVERIMSEKKCSAKEAAILAMQEVSGPVVAIVLVLCAVFLPVAFMGGMTGVMYKQFAITVAVSVAISGLVALTLSPALCAVLLKEGHHKPARFFVWFNEKFDQLTRGYVRGVAFLNRRVGVAFAIIAVLILSIYGLFLKVPGELVPNEDQGYLISAVMLPDAAAMSRTQAVADQFDKIAMANPHVKDVITFSGFDILSNAIISNSGMTFITLKDWSERQGAGQDSFSLAKTFQGLSLMGLADGFVASFNPPPIQGMSTTGGLEAYLQNRGTGNAQAFSGEVQRFLEAAKARPEFASVTSTYRANVPQVYLDLDREKAKALGLPINAVFDTMQATFGQVYVNDFNQFGRTYRVQLQSEADYRAKKSDIRNVYVRSDKGEMIPLSSLVTVRDATGPELVERFNIFQAAKIMAQPAPGYSSGQAIAALEEVANEALGNDAKLEWTGSAYQEKAAAGSAGMAFGFGIVMIFLILAAQYERWSLPFAVITAVPFALFGALLATWLVGLTNNVYFQIGLVTLVGLAAKNAILIVEFAVMKHEEGMSLIESALEAARLRFRPIVMTSLAFILGCVPLVTSSGAGAASRHALGWPVIGGMLAATFIAIFFIPLFFRLIMRGSEKRA